MQDLTLQQMQEANGGGLLDILGGNNGTSGLNSLLGGFITITTDNANGTGTDLAISIDFSKLLNGLNLNGLGLGTM